MNKLSMDRSLSVHFLNMVFEFHLQVLKKH